MKQLREAGTAQFESFHRLKECKICLLSLWVRMKWVIHKWLQSEEGRRSRRNDEFNWCRVTAFTFCYTFLSVEVIFVCNLRLPYKYLAPLYHDNRSGPNSFVPFVTHNSAHRLCSQTHPWLRNSSETHHSVPRYEPVTAAQKSSRRSINSKNVNFACFQSQMSMNGSFTNGLQWNELKLIVKSGKVERLMGLNVHQDGWPTCTIPTVPECSSLREIEANINFMVQLEEGLGLPSTTFSNSHQISHISSTQQENIDNKQELVLPPT